MRQRLQNLPLVSLFVLCAVLGTSFIPLKAQQVTIELTKPGKLSEKLSEIKTPYDELIITGSINGNDLAALRALSTIKILDLKATKIVKGGGYKGGAYNEPVNVEENVFPDYFLFNAPLTENLVQLSLPEGTLKLGVRALQNASKLAELNLSESLTEIGEMALGYCTSLEGIELPDALVAIKGSAFEGCKALANISLPENLNELGGSAFKGCTSLTEITIPASITKIEFSSFENCTALEVVDLPMFITQIDKWAFAGCEKLESLKLPAMLTVLGEGAFKNCSSLESVRFQSPNLSAIPQQAFYNCKALERVTIPGAVKLIGGQAFQGCESLEEINLPGALETIMGGAFAGTAIEQILIPYQAQKVGYAAFANCKKLTKVFLAYNNEAKPILGEKLFGNSPVTQLVLSATTPPTFEKAEDALGLESLNSSTCSLTIPSTSKQSYANHDIWKRFTTITPLLDVTITLTAKKKLNDALKEKNIQVGNVGTLTIEGVCPEEDAADSFKSLSNLYELNLAKLSVPAPEEEGTLLTAGSIFMNAPFLSKITLPSALAKIPSYMFYNCPNLRTIVGADALTSIGDDAFSFCTSLMEYKIPSTVELLGESSFDGCSLLREVVIPEKVESIPDFCFNNCAALENVTFKGGITELGTQAFTNCGLINSIRLPETLKSIGDYAFLGCNKLEKIECLVNEAPELGEQTFTSTHFEKTKVIVKSDEVKKSFMDNETWSKFTNIVVDPNALSILMPASMELKFSRLANSIKLINTTTNTVAFTLYSIDGTTLLKGIATPGENTFPLDSSLRGVAIITSNTTAYKVVL